MSERRIITERTTMFRPAKRSELPQPQDDSLDLAYVSGREPVFNFISDVALVTSYTVMILGIVGSATSAELPQAINPGPMQEGLALTTEIILSSELLRRFYRRLSPEQRRAEQEKVKKLRQSPLGLIIGRQTNRPTSAS